MPILAAAVVNKYKHYKEISNMTTQTFSSIYNFTALVTGYDPVTKIVTLDTPVNISMGVNQLYGTVQSDYSINGLATSVAAAIANGTSIPAMSTDEAGNFVGILNVPSTTFQTGQRVFRLDNRSVLTDPTTATTFAAATFNATGLSSKSAQTNYSPSVDSSSITFTQSSQVSQQVVNVIQTYSPYDPIAQSFIVSKDNYPNGIFIKSIKLFFATKPSGTASITVSIIPTLNGYPNGDALDYSTVTLQSNQVLTSATPHYLDPTTYTQFMFDAPVYIQPGVLYAVMIKSSSVDYTLYYAQQNQIAVPSTAKALPTDPNPTNPTKIGASPYVGALFESQNSITWTADQTKDLMFVIDQCVFDTTQTPQIQFTVPQNLPFRKLGTDDVLYKISANSVTNVYGNFSTNMFLDALNVTTTDFVPSGSTIGYKYNATLLNGFTQTPQAPIIPGKYGSPTPDNVYLNDGQGRRVLLKSSSSSFSLFATLTSADPNISPIISDDGVSLYDIRYRINNMGISNNTISISSGGSGYNVSTTTVIVSAPDIGSDPALFGFTANAGVITSIFTTHQGSGYLTTPTVIITDANNTPGNGATALIHGETSSNGGNAAARHFTKKVVMTPGNDSGDLRVYCTAYKPTGTQIYVYYKILSATDSTSFDNQNWQLMTQIAGNNVYSSARDNLIEYEFAPGVGNAANNYISYTNPTNQTFSNFIQFALKVVFATGDNTNVPLLTDIRALALPPGTGI